MVKKNSGIYFIMGVSGCGKSTIGNLLADKLNVPFYDGDNYHSELNVKKMASGRPLTDNDRQDWLRSLNDLARSHSQKGAVIACSALKESYRHILDADLKGNSKWIYLDGSFEDIMNRLRKRKGHFMPSDLLKSQFETLEPPHKAIQVSINRAPEEIVENIMEQI
ncbi:gluconokinase [uncultured Eudoraea sp.]|uniref:gluconokinase n=1 Tax=uncultured Eudoraea sp. TaxID=1035614 RepID=UPI0026041BBD|nr:gluconokinase [uncultured Eudoraea sp.]